jgi:hypothetical protein
MLKGIITADIIGSTSIDADARGELPELINQLTDELQEVSQIQVEIFRGDSFQVMVQDVEKTPLVAVLLRAGLRKSELRSKTKILDARMAIGIGKVSYINEKITLSDGEAFILSGREFDELGKRKLSILTPSEDVNAELRVETAFLDDVISHWTRQQSECIYNALLTNAKQYQLASDDNTSRQNVGKKLSAAKERLVRMYLDRVSFLIRERL